MGFWAKFLPFILLFGPVTNLQIFQCCSRTAAEVKLNLSCWGPVLYLGGAIHCQPCCSVLLFYLAAGLGARS